MQWQTSVNKEDLPIIEPPYPPCPSQHIFQLIDSVNTNAPEQSMQ